MEPYLAAQSKMKETLKSVDELQGWTVTRSLLAEYATQSNMIEGSDLPIGDAVVVEEELDRHFFKNIDNHTSVEASDLPALRLPPADALPPRSSERVVTGDKEPSGCLPLSIRASLG